MTDLHERYFTYILFSSIKGRFYIGSTEDIEKRIDYHNSGKVTSTKPYRPWELVGFLPKETRTDALILERKLKNLNTEDLKKFILKYFKRTF